MTARVSIYTSSALSSGVFDASGAAWRLTALNYSSGLPGGYLTCRFAFLIPSSRSLVFAKAQTVVVRQGVDIVWQGAIVNIGIRRAGAGYECEITALGPWQDARGQTLTATYASVTTGITIVEAALAAMATISTDYSLIANPGVDLGPVTYDGPCNDVILDVLKHGDSASPPNPIYFAIWHTPQGDTLPRAQMWSRSLTNVDWRVRWAETDLQVVDSAADVFNNVTVRYNKGDAVTAAATDATSIASTRKHTFGIESASLVAATAARDRFLAEHKEALPMLQGFRLSDRCRDGGGAWRSVAYMRAGHVMLLEDYPPSGLTFMVGAVDYTDGLGQRTDEVSVTPEQLPRRSDTMLGSGGATTQ